MLLSIYVIQSAVVGIFVPSMNTRNQISSIFSYFRSNEKDRRCDFMKHELCKTTRLQVLFYSMQDKIHFNLIVDLNTKLNLAIDFKSHLCVTRVLKRL